MSTTPLAEPGGSPAPTVDPPPVVRRRARAGLLVTVAGLLLLLGGLVWHLTLGVTAVTPHDMWAALTGHRQTSAQIAVAELRAPRALLAAVVGAGLALAGVLMQAISGNPLAAPDVLGISAGATFLVVLGFTVAPVVTVLSTPVAALVGAGAAGAVVLGLAGASRGPGLREVRLVLAGVTVAALLLSLAQGLIIFHENNAESVVFWLVGGVNYGHWGDVRLVTPCVLAGLVAALAIASRLNLLALGDEMAGSLGLHVARLRLVGALLVIGLTGVCVAVAGPVAFVGLVVPHIARRLVGSNHYSLLPASAALGATLVVLADAASHYVNPPNEVPCGVLTALIGAPYFIYLARRDTSLS